MDLPVANAARQSLNMGLPRLAFIYDVACKYVVNFFHRTIDTSTPLLTQDEIDALQEGFEVDHRLYQRMSFFINKFHLNGHKISCQDLYSLSYASLVGRVSGEEIETVWSYLNGFQYSTQEMSAGSRIDMLTDVINNFNLTKSIKACKCFH